MFTGEGRKAFLEFLRNLTPQIVFLTLALIWGTKLDLTKFDLSFSGIWNMLPFAMCLFVFFGAAIANLGIFVDASITSTPALDEKKKEIKASSAKALKKTWLLICAAWKHNKVSVLNLFLVMAICEIALVAVFIIAIQGAISSPFVRHG
ncbi:hypothetical protein J5J83_12335 [Azoarcus sp. L1K30]|uniref:hypothetical protein n=1 Tax=Azoarcus sp. L1K30 TaxID=2820277 RepID=UPI001B837A2D|nr:hypothetical protein [Azoarcus sp. L1K30]MBR0566902.1 hypothetical protein [Azoarcus sp. L1K30]